MTNIILCFNIRLQLDCWSYTCAGCNEVYTLWVTKHPRKLCHNQVKYRWTFSFFHWYIQQKISSEMVTEYQIDFKQDVTLPCEILL